MVLTVRTNIYCVLARVCALCCLLRPVSQRSVNNLFRMIVLRGTNIKLVFYSRWVLISVGLHTVTVLDGMTAGVYSAQGEGMY